MDTIPWVRGLKRGSKSKRKQPWQEYLSSIILQEEKISAMGINTNDAEKGLNLEPSRYWYVATPHSSYSTAIMIWNLTANCCISLSCSNTDKCGGVLNCDSGGVWHNHIKTFKNKQEKLAFVKKNNMTLSNYAKHFKHHIKEIDLDYLTIANAEEDSRHKIWEGRISINRVGTHINLNALFLSEDDKHAFIDYIEKKYDDQNIRILYSQLQRIYIKKENHTPLVDAQKHIREELCRN